MNNQSRFMRTTAAVIWVVLLVAATSTASAQDKCETIDANAMGTSTQNGKTIRVKFRFCKFSTPEDRQTLIDAFQNGQTPGLTRALEKMSSSGRISLPSTVGYDVAYAQVVSTPTGRQIRFITNRKIALAEMYNSTRSKDYSLTAGQIDLNDQDKSKNTGELHPALKLKMNKKGELEWEVFQNPWRLQNITDWGNKEDK